MMRHTRLELVAAGWRGRPLEPGEPVPGCDCSLCAHTREHDGSDLECVFCRGLIATLKAELDRRSPLNDLFEPAPAPDPLEAEVDAARAVPITEVADMLGIDTNRHGYARCPFHKDNHPSFHVNAAKGAAFCNPCGRRWDGIALVRELLGLDFIDAVHFLVAAFDQRAI